MVASTHGVSGTKKYESNNEKFWCPEGPEIEEMDRRSLVEVVLLLNSGNLKFWIVVLLLNSGNLKLVRSTQTLITFTHDY